MRWRHLRAGLLLAVLAAGHVYAQAGPNGGAAGQQLPLYGPSVGVAGSFGAGPLPGPSLDLNFINGSPIDSRITYTGGGGTFFNAAGSITAATTNVPRIDYDPVTLAVRGLLIEEARTNNVTNNSGVGATLGVWGAGGTPGSGWIQTGFSGSPTITTVGIGVENGLPYTDISFVGSGAAQFALDEGSVVSIVNGQTWAPSWYMKLAGGSLANISQVAVVTFFSGGGGNTVTAFTPNSASLSSQRITTTVSTTGVGSFRTAIMWTATGGYNFTLRFGPAQLELGAFPTSYIPTTSAAATRAADVATMPGTPWLNALAGTLAVEALLPQLSVENADIASLDTGSNTDTLIVRNVFGTSAIATVVFSGNANRGQLNSINVTAGVAFKSAQSYVAATATVTSTIGGATPISTAASGFPVGLNRLDLSLERGGTANGYLRRVRYWPRAQSGGELQGDTR